MAKGLIERQYSIDRKGLIDHVRKDELFAAFRKRSDGRELLEKVGMYKNPEKIPEELWREFYMSTLGEVIEHHPPVPLSRVRRP